jgi:hypothetical protein
MKALAWSFLALLLLLQIACGGGGGGASGSGGATTAPSGLSYSDPDVIYALGLGLGPTGNTPTYPGGAPTSFAITPALPAGLQLNESSSQIPPGSPNHTVGAIWGTPTAASPKKTTYTVTASNALGSTTAQLKIAVADSNGTWREDFASSYATAPGGLSGSFATGQNADILLNGIDFNNAGGPGLYRHPGTVACDANHLVLADRNNNRILIWNSLPSSNVPPDLVLGQPDFTANNSGSGLHQLNFPVQVSFGSGRLAVTDTMNYRILLWDSFPTANQQPASRSIALQWPWGVWTNGTKLAAAETLGGNMYLWNAWPQQTNQAADLTLHGPAIGTGTPRTITSNGNYLIVGDHNPAVVTGNLFADVNFFWTSWPTSPDQAPTFFRSDPVQSVPWWQQGVITPDNHLVMMGQALSIWNSLPVNANQAPDLITLGDGAGTYIPAGWPGLRFQGGENGTSGVCFAGGRLYVSLASGNRVVSFNGLPTQSTQLPDFVLGAPDIFTDTLRTHEFFDNPKPKSDGTSLFVSSGGVLSVWKTRPDQSGAVPDYVFHVNIDAYDLAVAQGKLFLVGLKQIVGWTNGLPSTGAYPDFFLSNNIGALQFQRLRGVSWDGTWFAVSDDGANKIYVWNGLPVPARLPDRTIDTGALIPERLSSNGATLAVSVGDGIAAFHDKIALYDLLNAAAAPRYVANNLGANPQINFNGAMGVLLAGNRLFVADVGYARVQVWNDVAAAVAGNAADAILGQADAALFATPMIGRNRLFTPATLSFDGSYLWVGETKFSGRLLRFSVH